MRLREQALSGNGRALDRLLGLAQTFNNEELAAAAGLPADDAMVLELYRTRVLSGAAGALGQAEGSSAASAAATPSRAIESRAPPEHKVKRKRVRLKRDRRSGDRSQTTNTSPEDGGE